MIRPNTCGMNVEHCESCEDWEPIPFHDEGGLCLRSRQPARWRVTADSFRQEAEAVRKG